MTASKPTSELHERLVACREQIEISPYSHTVAAGWYAEDVPRLLEQFETMRSQAEEIITLRDASVAKRTVWLAQWGEAGWSADLGRAVANPARES